MKKKSLVSQVTFHPISITPGGLIGFSTLIWDNKFFIGNVSIYTRPGGGYRCLFPPKVLSNGKRFVTVHPLDKEVSALIEKAVTEKVEEVIGKVIIESEENYEEVTYSEQS